MDCLNDRLSKKDLGAFYTPAPYAKKAAELVEMAVDRALEAGKKDYVIIDRCVDGDTEYFNGTSWKKMRKYIIGEKVLIWDPSTNKALLETPKLFISKDADELLYNEIEISKKEKITLEIEDGILFRFRFPFDATEFLERWTFLTASLKASLIEELVFWNGKEDEDTYRTNKREIVHFLQMIAHSGGRILNEGFDEEADQYVLSFHEKSFSKLDKEGTLTIEQKDRKYCFRVSTGFLILKRNGKIFITGNCAGAGALEEPLKDIYDRNGDSLISHAIVSTYEYYEYKVLNERVGDLVREIIPPTEADVVYENGKVSNADAMSQDFIENPIIKRYLDDESCAVILFENPPYQDSTAITFTDDEGKRAKSKRTFSFVNQEYKKHGSELNESTSSAREISNLFIWSGFHTI